MTNDYVPFVYYHMVIQKPDGQGGWIDVHTASEYARGPIAGARSLLSRYIDHGILMPSGATKLQGHRVVLTPDRGKPQDAVIVTIGDVYLAMIREDVDGIVNHREQLAAIEDQYQELKRKYLDLKSWINSGPRWVKDKTRLAEIAGAAPHDIEAAAKIPRKQPRPKTSTAKTS